MSTTTGFAPLSLASYQPLSLSMQRLWLTGQVLAVGARLWVRHEFVSQETKPVEVIYGFALPRDAALRRFRISGDDFQVNSELRPAGEAHKIYEQGIQAGSLSILSRQYEDGLINLSVGNIRPGEKVVVLLELLAGVELHDHSLRLRFPFTLAPSYHAKARSLEIAPGTIEIELPSEQFDDLILPNFVANSEHLHQVGFCLDVQLPGAIQEIASPSHALRVQTTEMGCSRVSLARESDIPNRDLVLDVSTKANGASVFGGPDSCGKGRFAAVIPSTQFGKLEASARRLVILLDHSGSMNGTPLGQAKKAIEACLSALDAQDLFGLVAFSDTAASFKNELIEGNSENRKDAQDFLNKIVSAGGTELARGVEAAAQLLDGKQGDILIITDGQVFNTGLILDRARATGIRIHCLGIGSASQDRFLAELSSQTGGVSRFLTPSERVDLPAIELFASIGRPVADKVRVTVEGALESQILPIPNSSVFSGTPLLVFGEFTSHSAPRLEFHWQAGQMDCQFDVSISMNAPAIGNTLKLLQGSRLLTDMESRNMDLKIGPGIRKEMDRVHARILDLSSEYGLASSQMSLVAVVKRTGDVAGEIPKTQIVAVGLPPETLRQPMPLTAAMGPTAVAMGAGMVLGAITDHARLVRAKSASAKSLLSNFFKRADSGESGTLDLAMPETLSAATPTDILVTLAGMLEPDGGMPAKTNEIRIANSLAALLFFISEGHTKNSGVFRVHVAKLLCFLTPALLKQFESSTTPNVTSALKALSAGKQVKGDWLVHAKTLAQSKPLDLNIFWLEVSEAL